jgi:NAD(P)-dependent dehydrogenase (short-subunit alcohol dehydrogenase family)
MPTAIITGASQGLGRALATDLARDGWRLVVDARTPSGLSEAAASWPSAVALAGDVTDAEHRRALVAAAGDELDLLVLNASALGPSPLPALSGLPLAELRAILEVNVVAALGLLQEALPALRAAGGTVVAISSDAAVEGYEGWGGYGASKAALDQLANVLRAEEPAITVHAFDPGDMRTAMHQAAFPGEDISDRPAPSTVVPALRRLLALPGGRYRATDLGAGSGAGVGAGVPATDPTTPATDLGTVTA